MISSYKKGIALLFVLLFLSTPVRSTNADQLRLKDGSVLDGSIVSETESEILIEVSIAGGSIKQTRTILINDIEEVLRQSNKEDAQRLMHESYETLKVYDLNPTNSYPLAYYDKVIYGLFQKFLDTYPESPYESDVVERIMRWKKERNLVASGKEKYGGIWRTLRMTEEQRGQTIIDQSNVLIVREMYEEAIRLLRSVDWAVDQPKHIHAARKLEKQAYDGLIKILGEKERALNDQIGQYQGKAAVAAEANLHNQARGYENRISHLRAELNRIQEKLAEVKFRAPKGITQTESSASDDETPDILLRLSRWGKRWWILAVAAFVFGLWRMGKAFGN